MHESVDFYIEQLTKTLTTLLHQEIDNPDKRTWLYDAYTEWVEDSQHV